MTGKDDVVARAIERRQGEPTQLLQILLEIQQELEWISPDTARSVTAALGIPLRSVDSVVQFYSFLYDNPPGQYRILFSDNITDRMLGNMRLFEHMQNRLKLKRGEVSADGAVSVDLTSCTGMCDQGPAVLVNNRAGHASDRASSRRDLRPCAGRRSAFRMACRFLPCRGQYPPRRRHAWRLATRPDWRREPRSRSAARACSTK